MPKGYGFSVTQAAIKKPGRYDIGLIVSEREATVAGAFTKNRVKAAPVVLDMKRLRSSRGQAIIVNSGNANACTGESGMRNAVEMAELVALDLDLKPSRVFVCSTGVIGTPMPMDRIRDSIPSLIQGLGKFSLTHVAKAIMTTDTFPKVVSREFNFQGKKITLAGCAKGAGMIAPDMATMLGFLITDAAVETTALRAALREAVVRSFNMVTVDGDMSTNDTVLCFANGAAGNRPITTSSSGYRYFANALQGLSYDLATMIARDGEGATKLVRVTVMGAPSSAAAKKAARSVANSLLVKTAIYGNDSNWGRIVAALGYSGAPLKTDRLDISMNGIAVVRRGLGTGNDAKANNSLKKKEVNISIHLNSGKNEVTVLTCDLSEDYVKINAEYRT